MSVFSIITDYILDIRLALFVILIFIITMIVFLGEENAFGTKFFYFGPLPENDPDVRTFLESKITTWTQVITLYVVSFFSGVILNYYITVGRENSYLFNSNVLEVDRLDRRWGYLLVILNPIIFWVTSIMGIFLTSTKQFQFLLPAFVAALLVDIPYGIRNIRRKKFIGRNKSIIN